MVAIFIVVGVVGVVALVLVTQFSNRLGVTAPLVLVVLGIAYSFVPGVPRVLLPPDLVLEIILPLLLYAAAIQVSLVDFRRSISSIATLSVTLVVASAFVVAVVLHAILPALPFGAALALGAVVSPTDAVAATSIAKRLGLPTRLVTILEGESLVNDPSALVLLRAALASIGVGLSGWALVGEFSYSVVVAVVIGVVIGIVTMFVRSRLPDAVLDTAISFTVPFLAFIPAQALGASGLVATVAAGLISGAAAPRRLSARARLSERLNWRTAQFVLENGVFLLMGAQLVPIVEGVRSADHPEVGILDSVLLAVLVVALLIGVRALAVVGLVIVARRSRRRAPVSENRVRTALERLGSPDETASVRRARRGARLTRILRRRLTDLTLVEEQTISWKGSVVLVAAGMRGVVTLAAAQSIPSGTPFRNQLILIAFAVAVFTLLGQGGTLPALIRATGIRGSDESADRRRLAALIQEMTRAGLDALSDVAKAPDGRAYDAAILDRVRAESERRQQTAGRNAQPEADDPSTPFAQYRSLRARMLEAERSALTEARSRAEYPSRIIGRAQRLLDAEEARLDGPT